MDYNNFAKTFSNSRKNMKWEEIEYFLEYLQKNWRNKWTILDVWCWNGRFLDAIEKSWFQLEDYLWTDLSRWLIEEAKNIHKNRDFVEIDMLDLYKIDKKYDFIFFIASYHHLENIEDREKVLSYTKKILNPGGIVFMTNWALNSELNHEKYQKSIVEWSENYFWWLDYSIKIWEFTRYYHCFLLEELSFLSKKSWFEILENSLFDNNRNFITILM